VAYRLVFEEMERRTALKSAVKAKEEK